MSAPPPSPDPWSEQRKIDAVIEVALSAMREEARYKRDGGHHWPGSEKLRPHLLRLVEALSLIEKHKAMEVKP